MTATSTKMPPQNITLQYRKSFAIIPSRSCCTMWAKYPKNKLGSSCFRTTENVHIGILTLLSKRQFWWLHIVVMQSTARICTKMHECRRCRTIVFPLSPMMLQCNAPYRGHPTNFHIWQPVRVNTSTQQLMQLCSTYNRSNFARRHDCHLYSHTLIGG